MCMWCPLCTTIVTGWCVCSHQKWRGHFFTTYPRSMWKYSCHTQTYSAVWKIFFLCKCLHEKAFKVVNTWEHHCTATVMDAKRFLVLLLAFYVKMLHYYFVFKHHAGEQETRQRRWRFISRLTTCRFPRGGVHMVCSREHGKRDPIWRHHESLLTHSNPCSTNHITWLPHPPAHLFPLH